MQSNKSRLFLSVLAIVFVSLLFVSAVSATAFSVTKIAGYAENADLAGTTKNWSNEMAVTSPLYYVYGPGLAKTGTLTSGGAGKNTEYLKANDFGFNIPSNMTITGVKVTVGKSCGTKAPTGGSLTGFCVDNEVKLVKNDVIQSTNKADKSTYWFFYAGADSYFEHKGNRNVSYGGSNDLWNTALTANDVNSNDFGVVFSAANPGTSPGVGTVPRVSTVYITVTYNDTVPVSSDSVAPIVSVPSTITQEATSADGATVNFSATANDNIDGAITPICTPASGSLFAIQTTSVTCTAEDNSGNVGSNSFDVIVQDTTVPIISLNGASTIDVVKDSVYSELATASDIVDGSVQVTIGGSVDTSIVGQYNLTYDAVDSHGNNAIQATRTINVNEDQIDDETAPEFNSYDNITVQRTESDGTEVTFALPEAFDNIDGQVTVSCDYDSGDFFYNGQTNVECSAEDQAGNEATLIFSVNVIDTIAPNIESENVQASISEDSFENNVVNPDDEVCVTWSNAENNFDIDDVRVDFGALGNVGSNIQASENQDGSYTACYYADAGNIDGQNISFTVTAYDDFGNHNSSVSNSLFVDNKIPSFVSAVAVSPNTVVATFSEDLIGEELTINDFEVSRGGFVPTSVGAEIIEITNVSEENGIVTLTLAESFQEGDSAYLTVNPNTPDSIIDVNDNELFATSTLPIVDGIAPVVTLGNTFIVANANQDITFTSEATDIFSGIDSADWDFGDGNSVSNDYSPVHAYSQSGIYFATLTVYDEEGNSAEGQAIVIIGNASYEVSPGLTISFQNLPNGYYNLDASYSLNSEESTSGFLLGGNFYDLVSNLNNGEFNVTLTISYNDSDNNGIVDNTSIAENDLNVYFFNVTSNAWEALANPVRDTTLNTISVTSNHFTTFTTLSSSSPGSSGTGSGGSGGGGSSSTNTIISSGGSTGLKLNSTGIGNNGNSSLNGTNGETPGTLPITGGVIGTLGTRGSAVLIIFILIVVGGAIYLELRQRRVRNKAKKK